MITKGHEFSVAVELGHAKKPKIKVHIFRRISMYTAMCLCTS